jgi:iron transport multicopper oxidase
LQAPSIVGPAESDATLINGKGRAPGGPAAPIEIINVKRGTRYRFRLISMSCDPNYRFSIDGHNMTIIETDGQPTEPHTVQEITIFAGTPSLSVSVNALWLTITQVNDTRLS